MERKEKGVEERGSKRREGETSKGKIKLKRGMILVGKRGGPSTPSPTWRLEFSSSPNDNNSNGANNPIQEFLNTTTTTVSARKLCANLWEVQPQVHLSVSKLNKNLGGHRRAQPGDRHKDKKAHDYPPDQLASTSTLRKPVSASLVQHHRSAKRNDHAVRPLSPASCGSSMEVAPYNPAVTPTSSLDFKGRGESSYSLKTSTELLKVLNRIWSLEEQQASNLSLLRALKMELDHSQSQIKELLKEKEASRQEMDHLMKQIAEDKVTRKNKEQDRMKSAVQSVQEELEDERKLRKHSESLHRKLARELSEVKYSFSSALKELERERKARFLLENLCDEFAKGIRDFEQEVRSLRHKPNMDNVGRENPDRLVLHISEAWLDERMQMKLAEAQNDIAEKNTIIDKLSLDIETFLQARHSIESRNDGSLSATDAVKKYSRRESFPLNESASAPQDVADEDSTDPDSPCLELNKIANKEHSIGGPKRRVDTSESHLEKLVNSNSTKIMADSRENCKFHNSASFQLLSEEHMARNKTQVPERGQGELRQQNQDGINVRKSKCVGTPGLNSKYVLDNLIRNQSLSSEGEKIHPEVDFNEDACVQPVFAGHASPVQQWMSKLTSPEFEKSEASLKLTKDLKENTLRAKLLEARLEGQKSRLRALGR